MAGYPPPDTTREEVAAAVRGGAVTTGEIAAWCWVPDDDRLRWFLAGMVAEGWFVQRRTCLVLAPGR